MTNTDSTISVRRLRAGVLMLLIWWIPIWLFSPVLQHILKFFGVDVSISTLTVIIAVIQTIVGLFGAWLAGPEIVSIVRKQSFKKAPKVMWHILISGQTEA